MNEIRIYLKLLEISFLNLFKNFKKNIVVGCSLSLGVVGLMLVTSYVRRINHCVEVKTVYLDVRGHVAILRKNSLDKFITKKMKIIESFELNKISKFLDHTFPEATYSKVLQTSGYVSSDSKSVGFIGIGIENKEVDFILNNKEIASTIPDWILRSDRYLKNIEQKYAWISLTPIMQLNLSAVLNSELRIISEDLDNSLAVEESEFIATHTTGMEFKEPYSLISTYELFSNLLKTDGASYVAIFLNKSINAVNDSLQIQNFFNENNLDLEAVTFQDKRWNSYYFGTKYFLYFLGSFFSILILLSSCLSMITFNYLNLEERKNEMGLLGSLGYSSAHVQSYFIFESLLVSLLSSAVGLFLGLSVIQMVNSLNIEFSPPGVSNSIFFMLESSVMNMFLIAGAYIIISFCISFYICKKSLSVNLNSLLNNSGV